MKNLGAWSHEMFISEVWVNSLLVNFEKRSVLLGVFTLLILNRAPIHEQNNCTGKGGFLLYLDFNTGMLLSDNKCNRSSLFLQRLQIMKGSVTDLLSVVV